VNEKSHSTIIFLSGVMEGKLREDSKKEMQIKIHQKSRIFWNLIEAEDRRTRVYYLAKDFDNN
jgi:hypothetical protein